MRILRAGEVPTRRLGAEERATYDSDILRIVITRMPPRTQNEHWHERLVEATYVLEGEIEVCERDGDGEPAWVRLGPDDCVVWLPGRSHNVRNLGPAHARTLTAKFAAPLDLDAEAFALLAAGDWIGRETS
jgi:mannose-6-phosphate isomerase-like protein (cupin superfamily)